MPKPGSVCAVQADLERTVAAEANVRACGGGRDCHSFKYPQPRAQRVSLTIMMIPFWLSWRAASSRERLKASAL